MAQKGNSKAMKMAVVLLCAFALELSTFAGAYHYDLMFRAVDSGGTPIINTLTTLTPLAPLRRNDGTNFVVVSQKQLRTDANGAVLFTNVIWGSYTWDVPGTSPSSWTLWVHTNFPPGRYSAALFITNTSAMPPNPTAN